MKILGIAGSLRSKSNTRLYVEKALSVLQVKDFDTELISLRAKPSIPAMVATTVLRKVTAPLKMMILPISWKK